jgi:hypothetical protein
MTDYDTFRLLHSYNQERHQAVASLEKMIEAIGGTVDRQTKVQQGTILSKLEELEKLVVTCIFTRNEAHNE